ncbi:hypothetical protein [Persicitalea jodogahamensis]|uniref:Type VI secretion system baseplate subunit TssK n=1 Tax=Persicitalea jodogahamensis TaxID=402147 RepID=A0A8J3D5I3_9BACT|nr:hypothetical protein [Persicitalea jodogahamensis]GHB52021.1 hypothetical protein GCM10007390_00780 [Persicitalea jodogahamensis]
MLPKRYRPVNWIDGMKVSKEHFIATNHYLSHTIREVRAVDLTPYSFGLCAVGSQDDALLADIQAAPDRGLHVAVGRCRAVTSDGSFIDINEENALQNDLSLPQLLSEYRLEGDQKFGIVLSVNLFDMHPVGEPDMEEIPPRHPFVDATYHISAVPLTTVQPKQWTGPHLMIAQCALENGEVRILSDFIPASSSINSHAGLREWHHKFGEAMGGMETCSYRIIQKIKNKSQKNTLSESVQSLAERLVDTISRSSLEYRWQLPNDPPIRMLTTVLNIAKAIQTELECLTSREKEELLNYLAEWAEETPGQMQSNLNALVKMSYVHVDSLPLLRAIESFFELWATLFNKLSQLEFIGKRKGQQVFIVESPVHDPPSPEKPGSRWSPI